MLMEIEIDYEKQSNESQAAILFKKIYELHSNNVKQNNQSRIAIIYSANEDQAQKLYASYSNNNYKKAIKGNRQAKTFEHLVKMIYDKKNKLESYVRILPISTIKLSVLKNIDEPVEIFRVIRDLVNIQYHLENDWQVIVLRNPPHLAQRYNQKYQIGGGRAEYFYQTNERSIALNEHILSYGKFIESVLTTFVNPSQSIVIENTDDIITSQEVKNVLLSYKQFLSAINKDIARICPFKIDQVFTLKDYIMKGFDEHDLKLAKPLINVCFSSEEYKLIIECPNAEVVNRLMNMLRRYDLNELGDNKCEIPSESVYAFLVNYCQIPFSALAFHYADYLKDVCGYESIIITPFYFFINNRLYTLEQALEEELFASKKHKGDGHREYFSDDVNKLIQFCFDHFQEQVVKTCSFNPIVVHYLNQFKEFPKALVGRILETNGHEAKKRLSMELKSLIFQHYNELTIDNYHNFRQFTVEDFYKFTEINKVIKSNNYKLFNMIKNDISSSDFLLSYFKYWIYTQVALLSYIKGNFSLLENIVPALKQYEELFLQDFSEHFKEVYFSIKEQVLSSSGGLKRQTLYGLMDYHNEHFGPIFPILEIFEKWKDSGLEGEMLKKTIQPIINNISLLPEIENFDKLKNIITKNSEGKEFNEINQSNLEQYKSKIKTLKINQEKSKELKNFLLKLDEYCLHKEYIKNIVYMQKILGNKTKIKEKELIKDFVLSRTVVSRFGKNIFIKLIELKEFKLIEFVLSYNLLRANCLNKIEIEKFVQRNLWSWSEEEIELKNKFFGNLINTGGNKNNKEKLINEANLKNNSIQQLESIGLKLQFIPGDGNCLYNAVAIHLELDQQVLRQKVAEMLQEKLKSEKSENKREISSFIQANVPEGETIESYLHNIAHGNEWADNLEIFTLMQCLQRPIVIVGLDGVIRNPDDIERFQGEPPIFVLYNGHNHYDGFLIIEGFQPEKILEVLLSENWQHEVFRPNNLNAQSNKEQPVNKENLSRNICCSIIEEYFNTTKDIDLKVFELLALAIEQAKQKNELFKLQVEGQNLKGHQSVQCYLEKYAEDEKNELPIEFFETAKYIRDHVKKHDDNEEPSEQFSNVLSKQLKNESNKEQEGKQFSLQN